MPSISRIWGRLFRLWRSIAASAVAVTMPPNNWKMTDRGHGAGTGKGHPGGAGRPRGSVLRLVFGDVRLGHQLKGHGHARLEPFAAGDLQRGFQRALALALGGLLDGDVQIARLDDHIALALNQPAHLGRLQFAGLFLVQAVAGTGASARLCSDPMTTPRRANGAVRGQMTGGVAGQGFSSVFMTMECFPDAARGGKRSRAHSAGGRLTERRQGRRLGAGRYGTVPFFLSSVPRSMS